MNEEKKKQPIKLMVGTPQYMSPEIIANDL